MVVIDSKWYAGVGQNGSVATPKGLANILWAKSNRLPAKKLIQQICPTRPRQLQNKNFFLLKIACCFLMFLFSIENVFANSRQINAFKTHMPPVVDGQLDDLCWQKSKKTENFHLYNSKTYAPQQSSVSVVYDANNLYFAIKCEDPLIRDTTQNGKGEGEQFEVFLDPSLSKEYYCQFIFRADGSKETIMATFDEFHLGELPWKSKVHIGKSSWTVELMIPFAVLHLKPGVQNRWGVNFCRTSNSGPDKSPLYTSWNITPKGFQQPDSFGEMILEGDFLDYFFAISTCREILEGEAFKSYVTNMTGKALTINIDIELNRLNGTSSMNRIRNVEIADKSTIIIDRGYFALNDLGSELKIVISDAVTGKMLYFGVNQMIDLTPEKY